MFLTHDDRQALQRDEWTRQAVDYLLELKLYSYSLYERNKAFSLAESLYESAIDANGEIIYTPKESVDEELYSWTL